VILIIDPIPARQETRLAPALFISSVTAGPNEFSTVFRSFDRILRWPW